MAVVVTGAAGFLGGALAESLLAAGDRVVAIDRRPLGHTPRCGPGDLSVLTTDIVSHVADHEVVADPRVSDALVAADAVIHLAGCPGVRDGGVHVAGRRHRDNVLATAAVVRAVRNRTPLVVASSSSVYGGSDGAPCAESATLRPRGGYARSKAMVEALCGQRLEKGGRVAIVRPFTVAGEGQRPDMALARWLRDAHSGRALQVFGSLRRSRDVTDVRDVVAALRALAGCDFAGTVNIGTGIGQTLGQLVDAVGSVLDADISVDVVPAVPEDPAATLADTTLLRRVTGLVPHTDLHRLVARQAAAAGLTPVAHRQDAVAS